MHSLPHCLPFTFCLCFCAGYLQEKISAKFGMYASGVSVIAAAGITALIGFMRRNKSKTGKIQQPDQKPISEHTESHWVV